MGYRHFKTFCALRVLAISATACLFFFLYFKQISIAVLIAVALAIPYQIQRLIRYVDKTNRDLARFLNAVRYEDFSQTFTGGARDSSFTALAEAFSGVTEEIKKARSKTEEHYRYLQTVVEHVGIGMVSFQENGDVELFNRTAKRYFGLDQLKNLSGLDRFSPGLADQFLSMNAGGQSLISIDRPQPMQLSVHATEFRMRGQKFTLVSLQNIQNELERERMAKELEIAHQVQLNLLPKTSPEMAGVRIAGACIPAREVGGDYFDFITLGPRKLGIAIGDVSGKGLPAAIYMTLTKGVLQSEAAGRISPKQVLTQVNKLIYQSMGRGTFVSMVYAVLDMEAGTFTYARAGHNPPIHLRSQGEGIRLLDAPGIGLGLDSGETFHASVTEDTFDVSPGDWIVCYTDGITEAMDDAQQEFGEQRFIDLVQKRHTSPEALLRATHQEIHAFTGNGQQHDDMTLVALQFTEAV